jgi:hypothetical protein
MALARNYNHFRARIPQKKLLQKHHCLTGLATKLMGQCASADYLS